MFDARLKGSLNEKALPYKKLTALLGWSLRTASALSPDLLARLRLGPQHLWGVGSLWLTRHPIRIPVLRSIATKDLVPPVTSHRTWVTAYPHFPVSFFGTN
jgi:hypothetical protein